MTNVTVKNGQNYQTELASMTSSETEIEDMKSFELNFTISICLSVIVNIVGDPIYLLPNKDIDV